MLLEPKIDFLWCEEEGINTAADEQEALSQAL